MTTTPVQTPVQPQAATPPLPGQRNPTPAFPLTVPAGTTQFAQALPTTTPLTDYYRNLETHLIHALPMLPGVNVYKVAGVNNLGAEIARNQGAYQKLLTLFANHQQLRDEVEALYAQVNSQTQTLGRHLPSFDDEDDNAKTIISSVLPIAPIDEDAIGTIVGVVPSIRAVNPATDAFLGMMHFLTVTDENRHTISWRLGTAEAVLGNPPPPLTKRDEILKKHLTVRIPYLSEANSVDLLERLTTRILEQEKARDITRNDNDQLPSEEFVHTFILETVTRLKAAGFVPVAEALEEQETLYRANRKAEIEATPDVRREDKHSAHIQRLKYDIMTLRAELTRTMGELTEAREDLTKPEALKGAARDILINLQSKYKNLSSEKTEADRELKAARISLRDLESAKTSAAASRESLGTAAAALKGAKTKEDNLLKSIAAKEKVLKSIEFTVQFLTTQDLVTPAQFADIQALVSKREELEKDLERIVALQQEPGDEKEKQQDKQKREDKYEAEADEKKREIDAKRGEILALRINIIKEQLVAARELKVTTERIQRELTERSAALGIAQEAAKQLPEKALEVARLTSELETLRAAAIAAAGAAGTDTALETRLQALAARLAIAETAEKDLPAKVAEIAELTRQLGEASEKAARVEGLVSRVENLTRDLAEANVLVATISAKDAALAAAEAELSSLRQRAVEGTEAQERAEALRLEIETLTPQLEEARTLALQLHGKEEELSKIQTELQEARAELEGINYRSAEAELSIEALRAVLDARSEALATRSAELTEARALADQVQPLRDEVARVGDELRLTLVELAGTRSREAEAGSAVTSLQQTLAERSAELARVQALADQVDTHIAEIATITTELQRVAPFEAEVTKLNVLVAAKQVANDALNRDITAIKQAAENAATTAARLLATSEEEVRKLGEQRDGLLSVQAELASKKTEVIRLQGDLRTLRETASRELDDLRASTAAELGPLREKSTRLSLKERELAEATAEVRSLKGKLQEIGILEERLRLAQGRLEKLEKEPASTEPSGDVRSAETVGAMPAVDPAKVVAVASETVVSGGPRPSPLRASTRPPPAVASFAPSPLRAPTPAPLPSVRPVAPVAPSASLRPVGGTPPNGSGPATPPDHSDHSGRAAAAPNVIDQRVMAFAMIVNNTVADPTDRANAVRDLIKMYLQGNEQAREALTTIQNLPDNHWCTLVDGKKKMPGNLLRLDEFLHLVWCGNPVALERFFASESMEAIFGYLSNNPAIAWRDFSLIEALNEFVELHNELEKRRGERTATHVTSRAKDILREPGKSLMTSEDNHYPPTPTSNFEDYYETMEGAYGGFRTLYFVAMSAKYQDQRAAAITLEKSILNHITTPGKVQEALDHVNKELGHPVARGRFVRYLSDFATIQTNTRLMSLFAAASGK